MLLYFLSFIISCSLLMGQGIDEKYFEKNREVYFKIPFNSSVILSELTRKISIDKVDKDWIYGYANKEEYFNLLTLKIYPVILPKPGDVGYVKMANSPEELKDWNAYPTYDTYVQMMNDFANNYPDICQLVEAGSTVQNRKILFVKISDNVAQREPEPQFMYSSTIHGDETTGYVLMLRLIDYLLSNYSVDSEATYLVNNLEIWINPLANPDGTYKSGNYTVNGATRSNANGYDLNRNFPDPDEGPNPTGTWQPETIAMMNIAQDNNFVLSANFHGGAEVVNYPWDTWFRRHPDDDWFQYLSHAYADTAQAYSPSTYMSGFNDGITNGWDWYPIFGGRQDYFTYFHHGRETTIELSDIKLLPASQLPQLWDYNHRSLINYMKFALRGIRGKVTDVSGNPLYAKITIENHDADSSEAVTDPSTGFYIRLLKGGTYTLTFSAEGYQSLTVNNVVVDEGGTSTLDVMLEPSNPVPVELTSFTAASDNEEILLNWKTATEINNRGFEVEMRQNESDFKIIGFVEGKGNSTEINSYSFKYKPLQSGLYEFRLKQIDYSGQFEYSQIASVEFQPSEFELSQNYPNPFGKGTKSGDFITTIKYKIPAEYHNSNSNNTTANSSFTENVKLKVYDILGREVAVLLDEPSTPGVHEVKFDASDLPSGIYYYQLTFGNNTKIRKMILLK